jgi:homocysteine S-methyltransferase
MQLSVELAFQARADAMKAMPRKEKPLVAASIGPYGAFLADGSEYRGNYGISIQELKSFHRNRIKILIEAGADILACETIPCLDEAIALKELLTEFPNAQAWISFSCKNETQISSGEYFADVLHQLNSSDQIIAVGVNCTAPQYITPLIKTAKENTEKLILVYPNKGEVWDATNKCWLPLSTGHSHFIDDARAWYAAGAKIIGGCCRISPADIEQLKDLKTVTA